MDTIRVTRTGVRGTNEDEAMKEFRFYLAKSLRIVRFVNITQEAGGSLYWKVTADCTQEANNE
jgi:hypothetical protein